MVSPSRLSAYSVTKKVAAIPSISNSIKESAPSIAPDSSHRSGPTAVMLPNSNDTVEASKDDPNPSTPIASALPADVLGSERNGHDDSDSACSTLSTTHAFADVSNNSDSTMSSVKAAKSKAVPVRPNGKAPKKTASKRPRADTNASSASPKGTGAVPAKKRARSNALLRSAPRATSTTTPGGLAGNSEFMNFTATIFIIQLGPDGPQFHAHESVLKRSPKLAEEIEKAKGKKRTTKQNTLALMAHDAIAFEQMLQFLYKDKFLLSKNKTTPAERLGEFKELMSLAKHYVLPGLQKQIIKLFSSSKIVAKIPPGHFFDWAEDMYYEELDHENGPFKVYLSRVAPTLIKGADEETKKGLARMVNQGGGFAEQLFVAVATALDTQTYLTAVKKEELGESCAPVRPHAIKTTEAAPVRHAAHEETSDTHEDEFKEDRQSLLGKPGPLTATKYLPSY